MILSDYEMDFAQEIIRKESHPTIHSILKEVLLHNGDNKRQKLDFTKVFWLVNQIAKTDSNLKLATLQAS